MSVKEDVLVAVLVKMIEFIFVLVVILPLSVMGGGCKRLETQVHFQGWLTSFSIRAAEEKASVM